MIRNLAITLVVIGLFLVFQPHIKAGIMEAQNAFALARVEMPDEQKEALRSAISRTATGFKKDVFSDVEIITLQEKPAELRGYSGKELDADKADAMLRRFETILERHKL